MQGYVGGSFSLDLAQQIYSYKVLTSTIFKLRSINVKTGAVIYDNTFPNNVVGHKYSPTDNAVYGMWDNAGVYQLEKIDYVTGMHSMVATYSVMTPGFVGESQSMNQNGEYTFRGFDINNKYTLFTIDVTNGNILFSSLTNDNAVGFEEPVCISGTTSLKNNTENSSFSIYPNPNNGNFIIEQNTNETNLLQVFDLMGKLVFSEVIKTSKVIIDAGNLNEGVYIVSVSTNERKINKRLVITK